MSHFDHFARAQAVAADLEAARKAAAEAIAHIYPIGCVVTVRLGRAAITARVIGHGYFSEPLNTRCINLDTGKVRQFSAGYDQAIVMPEAIAKKLKAESCELKAARGKGARK